jgi:hypothetical protein
VQISAILGVVKAVAHGLHPAGNRCRLRWVWLVPRRGRCHYQAMVDVTVEARNDAGSPGAVKLQGETWELNIWATTDELWTLAGIENTDWAQRRTLKVGTCAGAPVWWDELDSTVNILVGHDAETWDMGVTIPLGTVHEILAELGEPPEVTPPPFGPRSSRDHRTQLQC